jgi:broad specificity phosphatase PhoE/ribonuclease HI
VTATRPLVVEADGGSRGNPGPAGYGAVVRDADTGEVLRETAEAIGVASNNVAEYRGLIAGLRAAAQLDPSEIEVRMDSKLVVEQMSGRWKVKHPGMQELAREAAALVRALPPVRFVHIRREFNSHADRLANQAMDDAARGLGWTQRVEVPEPEPKPKKANQMHGWSAPSGPPTTTWLLRHGETPLSTEKRFSGVGEAALTERGEAQAAAAAPRVAGLAIDAIVSSPLTRTRQTATIVAEKVGLDVAFDDGLRETDWGEWEGLTFAEVAKQWPRELEAWLADPEVPPPGGESFAATARRVRQARDRLVASYGGATLLVVSHVTPIKTLLRIALEAPPSALYRMHLDPASLSHAAWFPDGSAVVRLLNDTGHLGETATLPR